MRRGDRLFDVIQALRGARGPTTAAALAERLEVNVRTIYRDIATLQARRVPIEGAAGVGYVLRQGFDLPPLMFTVDEIEAIAIGIRLLRRLRDPALETAAASALAKVTSVLPEPLRPGMASPPIFVSDGAAVRPAGIDLAQARRAIRECRKLRILYADAAGQRSHRTIWPVELLFYVDVTLLGAWCELRADFRHFRVERVLTATMLEDRFPTDGGRLLQRWHAAQARESQATA